MNRIKTAKLGDVAQFVRGITFKPDDVVPSDTPGAVRCMRTKNVQTLIDLSDVWAVDERFIKRSEQYLHPGDLLVSTANSWNLVGKCCWVPSLDWRATFGGFISVLRADASKIYPRYLYHWFSSKRTQVTVRSFGRQTTNISNLNLARCLEMTIPLPSYLDQRKIATVLDRADDLRAKRREAIALLDDLAQSVFYDMFDDLAMNARGWGDSLSLGDVAEVTSGITKGRKASGALRPVPYMAVLNVQDKMLDLSVVKEIEATEAEIQRYRLIKDDLLLTEGGDPDKLGRGTLWQNELPEAIHQNHIFRVRLRPDSKVEPNFLNWLLASERGRRYFLRSAKQTTGIASINATQLRQFPLVVPPLVLQNEFAVRLGKIKAHKSTQQAHLAELDNLFASLQQRAFRGELWDTRDN